MARQTLDRLQAELACVADGGLDFVELVTAASEVLQRSVTFDRSCWHTVDPGTVLFTASVNRGIACSGRWLAQYEYEVDDVNQWWFLARSGQVAGRSSAATGGELRRSARFRSMESSGVGDELRVAFVCAGVYWGAAGFLRDVDRPWFSDEDERTVRAVASVLASGCRRALVSAATARPEPAEAGGPGVIVLDEDGNPETVTPAAAHWVGEIIEEPAPSSPADSKIVQSVAAQARARGPQGDPLAEPSRVRVRTRSGEWLTVYATTLSGGAKPRIAVVMQPAAPADVAPLVALAHGLTNRETEVARLCLQGRATAEIARAMGVTAYTVQDHLKAIFEKTGTRTRNELVGRVFLSHYATRWEDRTDVPSPWTAKVSPEVWPRAVADETATGVAAGQGSSVTL